MYGIPNREQRLEFAIEQALVNLREMDPVIRSEIRSRTDSVDQVQEILANALGV